MPKGEPSREGGGGGAPYYHPSDTGMPVVSVSTGFRSPFPRFWLQIRCASCVLDRSYGDPPRLIGTISSTSARIGCGTHPWHGGPGHLGPCLPGWMVSVLSTHCPHSAQCVSVARTLARTCLRLCPLADRGLLATSASPHCARMVSSTCCSFHVQMCFAAA